MLKRLRLTLALAALTLAGGVAHAQLAAYGTFEGDHLEQNSRWLGGGTLGIYDDFYHLGPVHLGADVRGSHTSGDNTDLVRILTGVRLAVKPPVLPIRPYVEVLGGGLRENAGSLKGSYHGTAEAVGGVDFTFFPHLDWRVIEAGGQVAGNSLYNNFHISTGLVVRFF